MNGISARLAAASGAYFVGAAILGSLGPTGSKVGVLVIVSGLAALLVFLGFLQRLLSHRSEVGGIRPAVTMGFGLVFVAMQATELAYFGVEYHGVAPGGSAALVRDLIEATFVASTTFFGLFVLSAAASGRARRVLPAWLAWFGVAVGVLTAAAGAVGAVSLVSHTPLPYMAALTWTVVVSVFLAARPTGQGAGAAPSAAPGQVDLAGTV